MTTVNQEELRKAIEYLGLDSSILEKGWPAATATAIDGNEQNGGDNGSNDLSGKTKKVESKITKSKTKLEEMEKACTDMKKSIEDLESKKAKLEKGEDVEVLDDDEEEKPEKTEKKEIVEKSNTSTDLSPLTTLLVGMINKSQATDEILKGLGEKIEKIASEPVARRSAENLTTLEKALGYNPLEEGNKNKLHAKLQKGRVSQAMFDLFQKGEGKDNELGNAITMFESSGYLDSRTIDFMKAQGYEIIQ